MSEVKKRNLRGSLSKPEVPEKRENAEITTQTVEFTSPKQNVSLKVLARVVLTTSLLIIAYYSTTDDKFKPIAKQSDVLTGKGQIVECSPEYREELYKYEGCFPRDCGRFVTDKVISEKEADALLDLAKKGLKLGGSSGGASILDLHSGALSSGEHFINIYKKEGAKNLFTDSDFSLYKIVKEKIKFAIAHHFNVYPDKIYLTHPTFFSEITSKPAVTVHDEYWHPHVDKETYNSFHYTTLLYLNDYRFDFKGGRFVFVEEKFNRTIEPRKGRLSMFTSGAENLHYVEKVTAGVRYAITISFTCIEQYAIQEPSMHIFD